MPQSPSRRAAWLLVFTVACALLLFPTTAPEAVGAALRLCALVLIPSLFPLFVLIGMLTELIPPSTKKGLMSRFLGISGVGSYVFLIGVFAGFPNAARMAARQVEQGRMSGEEADRITAFSSVAGPAFLIGGVGQGMLGSVRAGMVLWGIQIVASLLTALTLRLLLRPISMSPLAPESQASASSVSTSFPALLATSIHDGAASMLTVCAAVVFFAVLRGLLTQFLPEGIPLLILSGFLEITSCASECIRSLSPELLPLALSLLFAWSGCSVHAQVALMTAGRFPLRTYWVGKTLLCLYAMVLGVIFREFL